jgi:hypothetical protein
MLKDKKTNNNYKTCQLHFIFIADFMKICWFKECHGFGLDFNLCLDFKLKCSNQYCSNAAPGWKALNLSAIQKAM